jgi:riboflavin kinase/FMN adenylyltransferase
MKVIDDLTKANLRQETILTIGTFDGVHRGHQVLIGHVVERARATDRLAALVTFHPHPAMVLAPERAPKYLTTPGEKVALLERLGLDLVVLIPFNRQVAATRAVDFVKALVEHLRMRELWVGADFALGRNREGDVPRLRELGQDMGFEVHVLEPISIEDNIISSSRVRALLREGCVEGASQLLGRHYRVSGEVVTGARRGHKLGFPTANLQVRPERAVPADGVYAVFAVLGRDRFPAVANVGVRPTFDNGNRTIETHIFDFDQELYGCDLVIEFVARLRDELRFEDVDQLIAQMGLDSKAARRILNGHRNDDDLAEAGAACRYRYYEVDHTADRALWAWGHEMPDLYAAAARGMYSLMADEKGMVATDWREIRLEAPDYETLLIDWLNELLFLTEMEGLLFPECRIESLTKANQEGSTQVTLVAHAGGVRGPITKAAIKAATFHNLEIVRDQVGWSTTITLDV